MEEVLAKYFSGEATDNERSLVESWRLESKSNAESFLDAKIVWIETQSVQVPPSHILDDILRDRTEIVSLPWYYSNWMKYASAAVLVLAIGLLFVLNQSSNEFYISKNLKDGSFVALHEESDLEILNFDENIREVKVTGKAYFDIERDESRPFIIHTENATVKVLGTSFFIDSYNEKTEVCVESGLVELSKGGGVSVKLEKGEMGTINKTNKGILKSSNRNLNYLAWKTRIITFDESTMADVKNVIEDVYGIKVEFENPAFKTCRLTAKFNKKKPKDAIEIIAKTFNIDYEFSNGKAILKGKGC